MSIARIPAGITPDAQANLGVVGLMANVNNYCEGISPVTTAAGATTTLTAAQILAGMTVLAAGAAGAFNLQLPSTALLLANLGPTIPMDGTYAEPIHIVNNGVGQTGTIVAGDGSTTLVGTMTVATNTTRKFILTVTGVNTISIQNVGSWGL